MSNPAGSGQVSQPFTLHGAGAGAQQSEKAIQIYLPEIYPIPGSQNFNLIGQQDTAVAGTATLAGTVLQLPQNNAGVIRSLSVYITDMLVTTNVTFSILINNQAPSGFGTISMFPRSSAFVVNNFDCLIRVPVNAVISVAFTNNDGGAYTVGAALSGWYWSTGSAQQWLAGNISL